MDQYIGKKYKLKTSDNFEDYLKFVDIGLISRKTAVAVSPTAVLTSNADGSYTWTMSTSFRTVTMTFREGEEFVEERADGVKVKSLIQFEDDKMIQTQTEDNGRKSIHVRIFTPETLTVITTAEGWNGKCTRVYELVK
ncbi:probable fatty acid-binding protein [Pectinophora gossypiella]|uniref:probable fatty acid-binding protein n=1 Tax=Pectinophora gossypiella TaxID=13191 RepID=UPI00214F465C|nr:probable fatty acid-binding protein [Pectinophora gossypiella]XP_049879613.1 probable fatty acid-binding protein [Pectinophora gossypiella]